MSAWGVGRQSGAGTLAPGSPVKAFVDRVVQWIPADVIAIYTVGITTLRTQTPDPNPSLIWLIVSGALAFGLVLLAALTTRKKVKSRDWVLACLAVVAFGIWSLAIPDSGWYSIDWLANNPGWVALIAAVGGLIFGAVADLLAPD
ncbi:MAG: hypothetical protein QOF45_1771 [Gaiellaceae bacterium]|jgi:hypothetical protein|nr:hypothetical protein [Gaiellaceae bacterium]